MFNDGINLAFRIKYYFYLISSIKCFYFIPVPPRPNINKDATARNDGEVMKYQLAVERTSKLSELF